MISILQVGFSREQVVAVPYKDTLCLQMLLALPNIYGAAE